MEDRFSNRTKVFRHFYPPSLPPPHGLDVIDNWRLIPEFNQEEQTSLIPVFVLKVIFSTIAAILIFWIKDTLLIVL